MCEIFGTVNLLVIVLYFMWDFKCVSGGEVERRSCWDRWGLTRGKRDKTVSQPDIPSAIARDSSGLRSRQYSKLASGTPVLLQYQMNIAMAA